MVSTNKGLNLKRSGEKARHGDESILLPEPKKPTPFFPQLLNRAASGAAPLMPNEVVKLQRAVGNRTTARWLNSRHAPKLPLQPKAESGGSGASFETGEGFEKQLASTKAGGAPLEPGLQAYMEPRFGSDFSSVRVHTGRVASKLNRAVNAQAFTHGSDIYLNQGKYAPGTTGGMRLMAHELAHVVQQQHTGIRRIMRWGEGTKHNEVTKAAFERDATLSKMYSSGAQKLLGTMSDMMDMRAAFWISYLYGAPVPTKQAYHQWSQKERQAELDHIASMEPKVQNAYLDAIVKEAPSWAGKEKKYEETVEQKKEALKDETHFIKSRDTFTDWRISASAGKGPKKLPAWALKKDKRVQLALREHLKRIGDPRFDPAAYDNMIVSRIEGEPENHAEGGRYRQEMQASAEAKSSQRVQEYLTLAINNWNSGNRNDALRNLGLGLHAAEDRGAHGDGIIGKGHDPRRLLKPPEGADTAYAYYNTNQPWKGEFCDDKAKNPKGFKLGVVYAQQVLQGFLVGTLSGREGLTGKVKTGLLSKAVPFSTVLGRGIIRNFENRSGKMKFTEGVDDKPGTGKIPEKRVGGPDAEAQFKRLENEEKKREERKAAAGFQSSKVQSYVHSSSYKGFRAYMNNQPQSAQLRLWQAIQAYQRSGEHTIGTVIYQTYLAEGAKKQTGLDQNLVKEIKDTLDYYKPETGMPPQVWKKEQRDLFAKLKPALAEKIEKAHTTYKDANPSLWELFKRGLRKKK